MLKMVGTTRFELTTSSTPRKRSTKLSYVPNKWYYNGLFSFCQSLCVICFMRRSAPISTPVSRATCSIVRPARRSARALMIASSSFAGASGSMGGAGGGGTDVSGSGVRCSGIGCPCVGGGGAGRSCGNAARGAGGT